jgi:single-stranded-DNA-specific exonuclease
MILSFVTTTDQENSYDAVAILDQNETIALIMMNCGCGIGFKLIQVGSHQNQTTEDLIPYLDLVSAAIAADIVPMTGENRY